MLSFCTLYLYLAAVLSQSWSSLAHTHLGVCLSYIAVLADFPVPILKSKYVVAYEVVPFVFQPPILYEG